MHEVARSADLRVVILKQPHLIPHTRVAQPGHAQACVHDIRKRNRGKVAAAGFHHQPHHLTGLEIEQAPLNQPLVHHGVEVAVVDDVIHVAIDIVVHPAGGNDLEMGEVRTKQGFEGLSAHGA